MKKGAVILISEGERFRKLQRRQSGEDGRIAGLCGFEKIFVFDLVIVF